MKRIIVVLFLMFISSTVFCQLGFLKLKKLPVDTFAIDIFSDIWRNKPADLKTKLMNPGINIYATGSIRFGSKSKFSFGYGIGLGMSNLYDNSLVKKDANNVAYFLRIPDSIAYKKAKLNTMYADIPLEIRFKSKSNGEGGLNATLGLKVGMLLDAHTKYKGSDLQTGSDKVKIKDRFVPELEKYRCGITARVGIGKFYLFGYYSLTTLFKKNYGPDMYPISFGISIIP